MALPPLPEFCRCCEPPASPAPTIYNRPGLTEIFYRGGSFATLRQAMLLEFARHPVLDRLTTRESDDYAVTLVELFAAMGDVLCFYNERIANELYLRTALERDSVLRLLTLIGYRLRPGLAAEAWLDFTLDQGAETRIRQGLKVMSVPAQDEKPLFFETLEAIEADWRLNALPVFSPPLPFNPFHQGRTQAPLVGRPESLSEGDDLVFHAAIGVEEKRVGAIHQARDGERLSFTPPVQTAGVWPAIAAAAKATRQLAFFGYNAPQSYQHYLADPTIPPQSRWVTRTAGTADYPVSFAASSDSYPLDRRYEDLKAGAQLLVDRGPSHYPQMVRASVVSTETDTAQVGQLSDGVTWARLARTIRGAPSVLVTASGSHVFARSGTATALRLEPFAADSGWRADFETLQTSANLGLIISEGLAPVDLGAGKMLVFSRDALARIVYSSFDGTSWSKWQARPGVALGGPAAMSDTAGRAFVFAQGVGLGLHVHRFSATGPVGGWTPLGGVATSRAAATSWASGRIDVFVRGPDRALYAKHWDGASWSPEWQELSGVLASAPAVAASAPGRLDVSALGDDGALIHRRFADGRWQDWLELGGKAQGDPAILATGADRVEIYVRGSDDQLWSIVRNGETWGAWVALGGALGSSPRVSRSAGTTLVAARGQDGRLVVRRATPGGWGPWGAPGGGLGAIADRRRTRIWELEAAEIAFREYDHPVPLAGGRMVARLVDAPGLETIAKDRRILIEDASSKHLAKVTAARLVASRPGEAPDHLEIEFTPALTRPLEDAALKGNIAQSSHGESQGPEPLGNGDATIPFQSFELSKSPLTYLSTSASISGVAELEVRVSGVKWTEVPSLYGRGPAERVYVARQSDDAETVITFGDGKSGARTKSGAMNIEASYRTGGGLEGRLDAGQLSIPLERPVGLRGVTNPFAAEGGADPETRDKAREAGPASVRTFGRAVSLWDFEWLALSSGLVAKARATWVWRSFEKAVHLSVAGELAASFSVDGLKELQASLDSARDPNRTLVVANYCPVPVTASVRVLRDPAYTRDDVEAAARAALESFFDFATLELGEAVHASNLLASLQAATGVVAVDLEAFHFKDYDELTATELALRSATMEAVQPHLRIYSARPKPTDPGKIDPYALACFPDGRVPRVLPAELAIVEDASTDLTVTVVEAL
jgi:hypothetical protein